MVWPWVLAALAAALVAGIVVALTVDVHPRTKLVPFVIMKAHRVRVKRHHAHINRRVCERMLCEFDNACKAHGVEFWLSEGTALGAVRDGEFIARDSDVDVSVHLKDLDRVRRVIVPALLTRGFRVYKDDRDRFLTLELEWEFLDIHAVAPTGECADVPGPCEQVWPHLFPLRDVRLYDRVYKAPPDAYLEFMYNDWRTPRDQKPSECARERATASQSAGKSASGQK